MVGVRLGVGVRDGVLETAGVRVLVAVEVGSGEVVATAVAVVLIAGAEMTPALKVTSSIMPMYGLVESLIEIPALVL